MKTQPLVPAQIDFSDALAPQSTQYADVYHARVGAFEQARHVFLDGNGLPGRWRGRARFVVLETGFGLGNNFLATWAAWRADPARSDQLTFISIEKHPLRAADLHRAHAASPEPELAAQLQAAWPPLAPNLHRIEFEQGRVLLLLALGDARAWLSELVADVDAFYLDGFAPALNPDIWDSYTLKLLSRLAAPGATAATWCSQGTMRDSLRSAGFEVKRAPGLSGKWHMTVARFAPHYVPQRPAGRLPLAPQAKHVLVIGAGLAGAACAHALRQQGMAVTVFDAADGPARQASGNPGGLFHGTLNPDDGTHARFNRAAALHIQRTLTELTLPWLQKGLLRLESRRNLAEMRATLDALGLPEDYVQALSAEQARALCGLPLPSAAWYYPGGGALPPVALVQALLADSAVRYGQTVAALRQLEQGWQAIDPAGQPLAQADAVVLATGHTGLPLLHQLAPTLAASLSCQRGQLSSLPAMPGLPRPSLPVAGNGYAIAAPDGGLWCGATSQEGDTNPTLRSTDQAHNLRQYEQLSATALPEAAWTLAPQGRVNWRLASPDRLPLVGGIPDASYQGRADQARLWPRLRGLALCTAMGSRGIGWAQLCGHIVAAQLSGQPVPLESSLLDAIDPARFFLRRKP